MGRRVDRKLNAAAVKAANAAVGNRKLDPTAPSDAVNRKKWMDAYEAAAGPTKDTSQGNEPIKQVCQPCLKPCIDLEYLQCDGIGVAGAKYHVYSVDISGKKDGFYEKEGTLDGTGRAHIEDVPEMVGFQFYFDKDPRPYEAKPVRKLSEEEKKAKAESIVDATGSWIWGTLQGDFNKDQSLSQIAVNAVLGLIPLVDQVLDVRDIIAGLKDLIDYYSEDAESQKKHEDVLGVDYETWLWINVFIIAIGCIPSLGSAIKGAIKGIIHSLQRAGKKVAKLNPRQLREAWEFLIAILNHVGVGNTHEWLKKFPEKLDDAATKIKDALKSLDEALNEIKRYASAVGGEKAERLVKKADEYKKAINKALGKLEEMKAKVNSWIRDQVNSILPGSHKFEHRGSTGTKAHPVENQRVQIEAEAPDVSKTEKLSALERIAAENGSTPAHIAARQSVATSFYKKNAPWMSDAAINDHIKGIDLSKPVIVKVSPPPTIVEQWQVPGGSQGNYYGTPGTSPRALGIGEDGILNTPYGTTISPKVSKIYQVPSGTPYLESTAAPIVDTWSIPPNAVNEEGISQQATGGGTQIFMPQKPKP